MGTANQREPDSHQWFARKVFEMRDRLQREMGDSYHPTIDPIMGELREDAKRLNIHVVKAFERAMTPLLDGSDPLRLSLLMVAMAELYLLRGRVDIQ